MIKPTFLYFVLFFMACKPSVENENQHVNHQEGNPEVILETIVSDTSTDTPPDTLNQKQVAELCKRINPKLRKLADFKTLKSEDIVVVYRNLLKTNELYLDSSAAFRRFFSFANAALDKQYGLIEQETILPDSVRLQIASVMSDLRGKLSKKP